MAKGAKLIRSIQAKVKYSILLLQHSLKKLLYFQKVVRQSSEQIGEYNLDSDKIKRSKAEYLRCQTSEMESTIKKSATKTR